MTSWLVTSAVSIRCFDGISDITEDIVTTKFAILAPTASHRKKLSVSNSVAQHEKDASNEISINFRRIRLLGACLE